MTSIYGLICDAVTENEQDYNDGLDIILTANIRLRIIKNFVFLMNILALVILVDSIKAKIVLIIAYIFYAILSHVVDEASGIVHTIRVLGEVCFDDKEEASD